MEWHFILLKSENFKNKTQTENWKRADRILGYLISHTLMEIYTLVDQNFILFTKINYIQVEAQLGFRPYSYNI